MTPAYAVEELCDLLSDLAEAAVPTIGRKMAEELKTRADNIKSEVYDASGEDE